jgi:fucose permease
VAEAVLEQVSALRTSRKALAGFLLSGLLFSFVGAILPAWGYHLRSSYSEAGHYFLGLNVGILVSVKAAQWLLARYRMSTVLAVASLLAVGAFEYLAFVTPPAPSLLRLLGIMLLGVSAGILNTGVFRAISAMYRHDPAATVNLAGILFGMGCVVTSVLVAGAFYIYTVSSILVLLSIIPAMYAIHYARSGISDQSQPGEPSLRQAFSDFRSLGAVLFTLLLFFQFGNEWAIAGWLPLFLVQRLGISPETSLLMLAFYWSSLLVGRIGAQVVLRRVSHGKLLIGSVLAALFGCVILSLTNNRFGATTAILLVGSGYAVIYPVVVKMIGDRFAYYHPGFFNGIFSFALTGGLLAPWTLGFVADQWGIQAVMLLPLAGTLMVLILSMLIWLEAKL